MRNWQAIVALVLVGCTFVSAVTPYARISTFGKERKRVLNNCAKLSLHTGVETIISDNYVFLFGEITVDGISTFDNVNDVFYYATDSSLRSIYSVNVTKGEILPPIDVYSYAVSDLFYDHAGKRLIISAYFETREHTLEPALVLYGDNEGPVDFVKVTGVDFGAITYNEKTRELYNYWSYRNGSSVDFLMTVIDLKVPTAPTYKNLTSNCPASTMGDIFKTFVDTDSSFVGVSVLFKSEDPHTFSHKALLKDFDLRAYQQDGLPARLQGTLDYFILDIDLSSSAATCRNAIPLTTKGGIVTAVALNDGVLYYAEAADSGTFFHTYDIKTKKFDSVVTHFPFEDLQIAQ